MPALNRKDTNLPIILFQTRQKLITDGVWNETTVFLGVDPDENELAASTSYCVITPGEGDYENWEAGLQAATLDLTIYHSLQVDPGNRADIQLTDQENGILQKFNEVMASLHLQDLVDGAEWILAEPMRLASKSAVTDDQNWKKVVMTFSIKFGYDPTAYSPDVAAGNEYTSEFSTSFT